MKSLSILFILFVSGFYGYCQGVYINIINGEIYEIQADYSLTLTTTVSNFNYSITDIAISPANKLYGVALNELVEIDWITGEVTVIKDLPIDGYVSLVCDNDYNLYTLTGSDILIRYNILSDSLTILANLHDSSPGDLTFYRGKLLFQSVNEGNFKVYDLETGILSTVLCNAAPLVGIGIWGTSSVFIDCDSQRVFASDYLDRFYELDIENSVIYLREHYEKFTLPGGLDVNGMASSSEHLASTCTHDFENITCLTSFFNTDDNASAITVYPNPATEQIVVESDDPIITIQVYSMTGTLLKRYVTETYVVDVSGFPNGVYIFQFQTDKGIINKKLVIQAKR